jgi:large subunit ribosomal protein L25
MDAIPDELPVDITNLGLDKAIRAADLQYDGINIVSNKGTVVCMVKSTRNSAAAAATEAAE